MNSTNIIPAFNRVLLTLIAPEDKIITLTEDEIHPDAQIVIVSVGPDVKSFVPGDKVMLVPGANILGLKSDIPGERLALIHDSSIVATLT